MSCFNCKYYTGEKILACGVDPITAASSPEEGCRDWQPTGDDYRPVVLRVERPQDHTSFLETNIFRVLVSTAVAYAAIAVVYAIVVRMNNNTSANDHYELSPPGSIQHIRE